MTNKFLEMRRKALAPRETEVYLLLANGAKTSEIANQLSIKANTVSTIKKVIFRKLGVSSVFELYKYSLTQK